MLQSKSMTYFMRRNKTDQLTHQLILKNHFSCFRVCCSALNKIPVPQYLHHVMKPTNMTLEYFTSSWICNSRAVSICDTRRFVDDTGVPRIFESPVRIISWSFFSNDGIFETCFFKSNLPVIYSLYQERDPFLWSSGIDIINNLFFGLNQFAS